MSKHGCCACAGMLVLPHGTHLHLSRVPACLAGTPSTADYSLHAGHQRCRRGCATAVLALLHARNDACRGCGLLAIARTTHVDTCGTLSRLIRLSVRTCRCYVPMSTMPPLSMLSSHRRQRWRSPLTKRRLLVVQVHSLGLSGVMPSGLPYTLSRRLSPL